MRRRRRKLESQAKSGCSCLIPELWRLRQGDEEGGKFQLSLLCLVRPCLQKKGEKKVLRAGEMAHRVKAFAS